MSRAFNVGVGKLLPWDDIIVCPQKQTQLTVESPFFQTGAREMNRQATQKRSADDVENVNLECPDPDCAEEFGSREELDLHLNFIGQLKT